MPKRSSSSHCSPPILRGEKSPHARLTERDVVEIRAALKRGVTVASLECQYNVGYMALYKVAIGATWKHLDGERLIPKRRQSGIGRVRRDNLFKRKLDEGLSNRQLARKAGVSESTIARAMRDARDVLAAKVRRSLLTSGSNQYATQKYGLTEEQVEALLEHASTHETPPHLIKELDDGV